MAQANLILPGTLEFSLALQEIPPVPTWRAAMDKSNGDGYLISRAGSMGLMEAVTREEWIEYCEGGELDIRMDEIDELDAQLEGVLV